MKRNMLVDEVNRFIADNLNLSNPVLREKIRNEFGKDLTPDAIRKRKANLQRIYGNNLQNHNKFAQDLIEGGFEPHNWNHGWLKSKTTSIFIKNQDEILSFDEIVDDLVEATRKHAPKYPTLRRHKIRGQHCLVLDIADLHIGKYTAKAETGEDYNIQEAIRRAKEGVESLMQSVSVFKYDKIVLVIGNDILHIDNAGKGGPRTTSGTNQDTDGLWWEMMDAARDLYVWIIELLASQADVHVVHNPSNHDWMLGTAVAKIVEAHFSHAKNVTFDCSVQHRKYILYGVNLIGLTHGDGAKEKDLADLMKTEAKKAWSMARFGYWYVHHLHHKIKALWRGSEKFEKEKDGRMVTFLYQGRDQSPEDWLNVEYLRSPSGTDSWHDRNAFNQSLKAIEIFIHHETMGQVARFTHYF